MKTDRAYLLQILESIRRIEEDTATGHDGFMASHTLQDALLRNLHVMSESTQRLSSEIKATQDSADRRLIGAFRNVLVRDCLGVDLEHIWLIVQNNVPELKTAAVDMLARLDPDD